MDKVVQLAVEQQIGLDEILIQLKKDLVLSGIDTDFFDEVNNIDELAQDMVKFVEELLQHRQDLFSNFIYRIDLPENQIKNIDESDLQTGFAKLVLGRIVQKIFFRKKFSQ